MADTTNVKKPNKVLSFFREVKAEIKKIVWPTPDKLAKDTGIVIAFVAVIGFVMWILGVAIQWLLSFII
ncbi:MAG: preprotein translocase subunit SecE [Ruminococcaceae bacterium]|nr:preprotein translocase subunit SecE [Oscillospiraceae bacterium]